MLEPKPPVKPKKGNARNGTTSKTLRTDFEELQLDIPRDRAGNFEGVSTEFRPYSTLRNSVEYSDHYKFA